MSETISRKDSLRKEIEKLERRMALKQQKLEQIKKRNSLNISIKESPKNTIEKQVQEAFLNENLTSSGANNTHDDEFIITNVSRETSSFEESCFEDNMTGIFANVPTQSFYPSNELCNKSLNEKTPPPKTSLLEKSMILTPKLFEDMEIFEPVISNSPKIELGVKRKVNTDDVTDCKKTRQFNYSKMIKHNSEDHETNDPAFNSLLDEDIKMNPIPRKESKKPFRAFISKPKKIINDDWSDEESDNPSNFRFACSHYLQCQTCKLKDIDLYCQPSTSKFLLNETEENETTEDSVLVFSPFTFHSSDITDYVNSNNTDRSVTFDFNENSDISINDKQDNVIFYNTEDNLITHCKKEVKEIFISILNEAIIIFCVFENSFITFEDLSNDNKFNAVFTYDFNPNAKIKTSLCLSDMLQIFFLVVTVENEERSLSIFPFTKMCHTPLPNILKNFTDQRDLNDDILSCGSPNSLHCVIAFVAEDTQLCFYQLKINEEKNLFEFRPIYEYFIENSIWSLCPLLPLNYWFVGMTSTSLYVWHIFNQKFVKTEFNMEIGPNSRLDFVTMKGDNMLAVIRNSKKNFIPDVYEFNFNTGLCELVASFVQGSTTYVKHVKVYVNQNLLFALSDSKCFVYNFETKKHITDIQCDNACAMVCDKSVMVLGFPNGELQVMFYATSSDL